MENVNNFFKWLHKPTTIIVGIQNTAQVFLWKQKLFRDKLETITGNGYKYTVVSSHIVVKDDDDD